MRKGSISGNEIEIKKKTIFEQKVRNVKLTINNKTYFFFFKLENKTKFLVAYLLALFSSGPNIFCFNHIKLKLFVSPFFKKNCVLKMLKANLW